MIALLRQRNYGLLWFGGLISLGGDWLLITVLPFYVYSRTGSALAASGMFAAMALPYLLFGSLSGVFVDRWDRRRIMIAADCSRAVLLIALLILPSTGWVWLVYVVAFVEQSIGTFFSPAKSALLPSIVDQASLPLANSLSQVSDNTARLLAPSLGGALLALAGLPVVVGADILSYVVSAVCISLLAVPGREAPAAAGATPAGRWRIFWLEWREGVAVIIGDGFLAGVFTVGGLAIFADGILTGLLVTFVQRMLHAGSTEFGWLLSARGLGGLGGSLLISVVAARIAPGRLLGLSLALVAGLLLVALHVLVIPVELVVLFLAGFPAVGWLVSEQTLLQTLVEDRFRGRVFGAYNTSASLLNIAGLMIAGLLALPVGLAVMLHVSVGLTFGAGVLAWLLLWQLPPVVNKQPACLDVEGESA
jgi:MFS family permease